MVNSICVIPARGGSKRIPQKNIISFAGKPMIAWTIEAASKSGLFHRIIVSTDDENIAVVSREYGAEVPFLRSSYHDDHSPVSHATVEAVKQAEDYFKESYDHVVQLMANCPLRDENDIKNAFHNYLSNSSLFQISVFKYGWMNPWWAMKLSENGEPEFIFEESIEMRSQDLSDLFCPTGAVWIAENENLKTNRTFYGSGFNIFELPWTRSIDIDDNKDLEMGIIVAAQMDK